ncbi:hypothetical protein F5882DRAFT_516070 [Hyaloscypha sp. PMI_1271]|nr:hypothetical protein F5882DRAFT_516070 [Hyaloscypha sp. PMI_1271]
MLHPCELGDDYCMKQIADAISKDGNKETTPDTTVKISNIENLNPKRKPKSFIGTKPTITRMPKGQLLRAVPPIRIGSPITTAYLQQTQNSDPLYLNSGRQPQYLHTLHIHPPVWRERITNATPSWAAILPNLLIDGITDPSPAFTAALTYALAASSFSEMEIDWYQPAISAAPDIFHQWRKLNGGKPKSTDTALWITTNDTKEYFYLGDEILQVMKVLKFPNDESPQTNAINNISPEYNLSLITSSFKLRYPRE